MSDKFNELRNKIRGVHYSLDPSAIADLKEVLLSVVNEIDILRKELRQGYMKAEE